MAKKGKRSSKGTKRQSHRVGEIIFVVYTLLLCPFYERGIGMRTKGLDSIFLFNIFNKLYDKVRGYSFIF